MQPHTRSAFDEDLQRLSLMIVEMGGLVERQFSQAIDALCRHDVGLAEQVVIRDARLDAFERSIEASSLSIIATRHPMAIDLRETISALHISHDLERIGDHARNIGNRVIALGIETIPPPVMAGIRDTARVALARVSAAIDCYASRSQEAALSITRDGAPLDALDNAYAGGAIRLMRDDAQQISACTHALFCIRSLERVGGHAFNIAKTVHYIVTGQLPPERR